MSRRHPDHPAGGRGRAPRLRRRRSVHGEGERRGDRRRLPADDAPQRRRQEHAAPHASRGRGDLRARGRAARAHGRRGAPHRPGRLLRGTARRARTRCSSPPRRRTCWRCRRPERARPSTATRATRSTRRRMRRGRPTGNGCRGVAERFESIELGSALRHSPRRERAGARRSRRPEGSRSHARSGLEPARPQGSQVPAGRV